jgi:hypothetical protein
MPNDEGWCVSDLVIRISSFFGHSALVIGHSHFPLAAVEVNLKRERRAMPVPDSGV